jgi:hypothetical protein
MTLVILLHARPGASSKSAAIPYFAAELFLPSTGKNPISKSSMFTIASTSIVFTPQLNSLDYETRKD